MGGPGPVQAVINTLAARTGLEIRLMAGNQYATQPGDWYTFAQACLNSEPCAAIYTFGFCDDVRFAPAFAMMGLTLCAEGVPVLDSQRHDRVV